MTVKVDKDIPSRLRGYCNAIVPQVAAAFVRAFMEARLIERGNAA